MHIKQFIIISSSANSSKSRAIFHQQSQLEKIVNLVRDAVTPLTTISDSCLIRQYEEQTKAHKTDLGELFANFLIMIEDSDDLYTSQAELERLIFNIDLIIKKLLVTSVVFDNKGVRLPKLNAPTFDGKFTN